MPPDITEAAAWGARVFLVNAAAVLYTCVLCFPLWGVVQKIYGLPYPCQPVVIGVLSCSTSSVLSLSLVLTQGCPQH